MSAIHVVHDIETMSTRADSIIVSIGATTIHIDGYKVGNDRFYSVISMTSQPNGHICPKTMQWWSEQSEEARKVFNSPEEEKPILVALTMYSRWLKALQDIYEQPVWVWGNGAEFDNGIVRYAYESRNMEAPWSHKRGVCYRTLKELYPGVRPTELPGLIKHHALDDAIYEAHHLNNLLKAHYQRETPSWLI